MQEGFSMSRWFKSEMTEKQRQLWEKTRTRGKAHFVLTRGVLGWGGFMFIFMTCMHIFDSQGKIDWPFVIISLLIWPLGGYGFGLWMWRWAESRFHSADEPNSTIGK